jgi:hypothetical protein
MPSLIYPAIFLHKTPKAPALPLPEKPRRRYQTPAGTHGNDAEVSDSEEMRK